MKVVDCGLIVLMTTAMVSKSLIFDVFLLKEGWNEIRLAYYGDGGCFIVFLFSVLSVRSFVPRRDGQSQMSLSLSVYS